MIERIKKKKVWNEDTPSEAPTLATDIFYTIPIQHASSRILTAPESNERHTSDQRFRTKPRLLIAEKYRLKFHVTPCASTT